MLVVLGRANSANVQKVLWCLRELRVLPYQREDYGGLFGRTQDESYLRLNPNGTVPTLRDGAVTVWESNSILRYLCNAYGPTPLYPSAPARRSQTDRWLDWQLGALAPAFMPLFIGLVREGCPLAELEGAHERTSRLLRILDGALAGREYLCEGFGLADIALGPVVHRWQGLPIAREPLPNLEAWYRRLYVRPGFREHVMVAL